jgi:hypothetical protein
MNAEAIAAQKAEEDSDEAPPLSQASMSSDLIVASQPQEVASADSLLQLAGMRRDSTATATAASKTSTPQSTPATGIGRLRPVTMGFSSFSLSISGINSPVIQTSQSTTQYVGQQVPLSRLSFGSTPNPHHREGASTGLTPQLAGIQIQQQQQQQYLSSEQQDDRYPRVEI